MLDVLPLPSEKINRVAALALSGKLPHQIAEELNRNCHSIRRELSRLRKKGVPIPAYTGHGKRMTERRVNLTVDETTLQALAVAGAQRGVTPEDFIARLLGIIIRENLVNAILDGD